MTDFNDQFFEKRLLNLKETQDSITGLSAWCLQHRESHKAIVGTWLKVLKKVKIDQRLTLFYLANDVIQYSKRKSLQFVESWGTALQKATTLVRDDKVKSKILRLFKIWNERSIYDEVFLSDLCGLLTTNTKKNNNTESIEFQPTVMFEKMKAMELLEDSTNEELTLISESPLNLNDVKNLSSVVKERRTSGVDVDTELEESIAHLQKYMQCLRQEVVERSSLLEMLDQGESFYDSQKKEAKVVSNAYKNFGSRVKSMKRKLDELVTSLPSPIPSPDVNAPSPSPHDDIDLPEPYNPSSLNTTAQYSQYNTSDPAPSLSQNNISASSQDQEEYTPPGFAASGFSSFIGSATLPFDIQKSLFSSDHDTSATKTNETNSTDTYEGNKIEVIGSTQQAGVEGPAMVPAPTATAQSSLESILSLLKPQPSQQYTPTPSVPVTNTQYTPTPLSLDPNNQYIPTQLATNSQYTPAVNDSNPYTALPPPTLGSSDPYTPMAVVGTQYTPSNVADAQYTPSSVTGAPVADTDPVFTSTIPIPPPRSSVSPLPLVPPPLPPPMFDLDEEFKAPPWLLNSDTHFSSPPPPPAASYESYSPPQEDTAGMGNALGSGGVNPLPAKFPTWDALLEDSPASPPLPSSLPPVFDRHAIDYEDANSVDIDDRSLPVISRLRKDTDHRHNIPDMDHRTSQHRNLISLTGSPKIDTDYRGAPSRSNSLDNCDSNGNTVDNTESVDMDLSDGEDTGKAQFKGSFNINTQNSVDPVPEPTPVDSPGPTSLLDIDPALILLDPTAEKILSSIDMQAITSLSGAISGGADSTPPPLPAPQVPEPRPQRPRLGYTGPRFRPRPPQYHGPPRRGGPPRFGYPARPPPPGMERGAYRPRPRW